jgi:acetoacetyl-[acyl-carrier protein] synthase
MLTQRWGQKHMKGWRQRNDAVETTAADYDERADGGDFPPIYELGERVVESDDLTISAAEIRIPGFGQIVNLDLENPFADMGGEKG